MNSRVPPILRKILRIPKTVARRLRTLFRLVLLPRNVLTPVELFRKDGWNQRIYNSVPPLSNGNIAIFGGYLGASTEAWLKHLPNANVHVFEPVGTFASQIKDRLGQENVVVHQFGIASHDQPRFFQIAGDATFLGEIGRKVPPGNIQQTVEVQFKDVSLLRNLLPQRIDVLEINIEGGEFELLDLLFEKNLMDLFDRVFVQFHDVGEDTNLLLEKARKALSATHKQVWSYELVWEMWEKVG